MTPRHSTRLSQEHEEPEDEQGQHRTAASDRPCLVTENRADLLVADAVLAGKLPLFSPPPGGSTAHLRYLFARQLLTSTSFPTRARRHDTATLRIPVSHVLGVRSCEQAPEKVDAPSDITVVQHVKFTGFPDKSPEGPAVSIHHADPARVGVGPIPEVAISQPSGRPRPQPADFLVKTVRQLSERNV
jgi:hypothetical protein